MLRHRSASIAVLAVLVLSAGLMGALTAAPAEASATHGSRPVLSASSAVAGETVSVTGRLSTPVVRRVVLQRRAGVRWRPVAAVRSARDGRYLLTTRAAGSPTRLRVVAARVRSGSRKWGAYSSPVLVLGTVSQRGSLLVPARVTQGIGARSTATFVPARPGRAVALQQLVGSSWRALHTGVEGAAGSWSAPLPVTYLGPVRFRAVAAAYRGAPAVVTAIASSVVATDQDLGAAITSPAAGAVLTGVSQVVIDVGPEAQSGSVTGVSLFLAGVPVGTATRRDDHTWVAQVDTVASEIPDGPSDLVAAVRAQHGRRVTQPVAVRVSNPTGTGTTAGVAPGFSIQTIAGGLSVPTSFAVLDAHRTLVIEKIGLVRMVLDGVLQPTPVLDLTAQVANDYDLGLTGLAADPHVSDNGYFYLAWTLNRDAADTATDTSGQMYAQRVARFTLDGLVADPASEHVLLGSVRGQGCWGAPTTTDCLPVAGISHSIDDLLFEPDGSLLVSMGDGALYGAERELSFRSQDLDVLAGKVLRIDPVTGRGLPDNPFYQAGDPGSNRSRVEAYGFRNPFRMSLRGSQLYVGDVGENSVEEVDHVLPGKNYGWPCYEGNQPGIKAADSRCAGLLNGQVPTVAPILTYDHTDGGTVVGGVFYDGTTWPAAYQGTYVMGDYSRGVIWTTDVDSTLATGDPARLTTFAAPPGPGGAVKFAMGPDGNVWFLSITTGELRRLAYDPAGTCPSTSFTGLYYSTPELTGPPALTTCQSSLPGPGLALPDGVAGPDGWSVRFVGRPRLAAGTYAVSRSADGTASDLSVLVDGAAVQGTFRTDGGYSGTEAPVDIEVDLQHRTGSDSTFAVGYHPTGTAPVVTLQGPVEGDRLASGSVVRWQVSALDAQDGPISAANLTTRVTLLHYGSDRPHQHPAATVTGAQGSVQVDDDHAPARSVYRLDAVATDSDGQVGVARPIYVCLVGNAVGPCA